MTRALGGLRDAMKFREQRLRAQHKECGWTNGLALREPSYLNKVTDMEWLAEPTSISFCRKRESD